MNDNYCLFVILASLTALVLPPSLAVIYLVFAAGLVWLAGVAGGLDEGGEAVAEPPNRGSREHRRFGA